MKTKMLFGFLLTMVLINFSCVSSSGKDDDPEPETKKGTHKILVEFTGDEDVSYIASFTGSNGKTQTKLFDLKGDYQGVTYIARGDAKNDKKIICETEKDATILSTTVNVTCIKPGKKVSYTVKAYINGKIVDQVSKNVTFTNSLKTDGVTISTSNSI